MLIYLDYQYMLDTHKTFQLSSMLMTLLVVEACPQHLFALKAILNSFAAYTCLKVNYSKSNMVLINMSAERLHHLAAIFQCQVGSLPFIIWDCH
jgi:hypothetical protein